jgi:hypothetical protein
VSVASIEDKAAGAGKIEKSEKTPLQSEEVRYWKLLLKAFLQPAMILLFIAAAFRHTGTLGIIWLNCHFIEWSFYKLIIS